MSNRPVRANRGQRPPLTPEQLKQDDLIYQALFQEREKDLQSKRTNKSLDQPNIDIYLNNRIHFPYCRSHHYYVDLSDLERVGTTTYTEDPYQGMFHFHDSDLMELYKAKGLGYQYILNRKYIGLPYNRPDQVRKRSNDKNLCHEFVFSNEDRKLKIDQLLYDLRYLQKHFQMVEANKARRVTSIKHQFQLASLADPNIPLEAKRHLINKRIQLCQQRKAKLEAQLIEEDGWFFNACQNQKFFNKTRENQHEISVNTIWFELKYMHNYHQYILKNKNTEESTKKVKQLFSIFTTLKGTHVELQEYFQDYVTNYLPKDYHVPAYIFNFSKVDKLQKLQYILSTRILADSMYYDDLKAFWSQLFQRELNLKAEYSPLNRQEYSTRFVQILKAYKPHQVPSEEITLPEINPECQNYMSSGVVSKISRTHFVLIYLLYYIYQRLDYFDFDQKLIAQKYFSKWNLVLLEKYNMEEAAQFCDAIDLFVELFTDQKRLPDDQIDFDIEWEFTQHHVGMVWLKEPEVWETENEQQQEQQQQEEQQNCESEVRKLIKQN